MLILEHSIAKSAADINEIPKIFTDVLVVFYFTCPFSILFLEPNTV